MNKARATELSSLIETYRAQSALAFSGSLQEFAVKIEEMRSLGNVLALTLIEILNEVESE